jgi:hypothetical protein
VCLKATCTDDASLPLKTKCHFCGAGRYSLLNDAVVTPNGQEENQHIEQKVPRSITGSIVFMEYNKEQQMKNYTLIKDA